MIKARIDDECGNFFGLYEPKREKQEKEGEGQRQKEREGTDDDSFINL